MSLSKSAPELRRQFTKAAVMRENDAPLKIEEVSIEDPGLGEVLVKTAASGIRHSDLSVIKGNLPMPPPCILGHEPAGIVEAVGEGVTDVKPGDHVIGCMTNWCGVAISAPRVGPTSA